MQFSENESGANVMKRSQNSSVSLIDSQITEFERLLASESHLLKTGQADGLEAIADAKQTLVSQMEKEEQSLSALFEEQAENDRVSQLKARLLKCRADNSDNHALVMLELKHTNKSLELLRSVLKMDDLSLYSEHGKVRVKREKRNIGSA